MAVGVGGVGIGQYISRREDILVREEALDPLLVRGDEVDVEDDFVEDFEEDENNADIGNGLDERVFPGDGRSVDWKVYVGNDSVRELGESCCGLEYSENMDEGYGDNGGGSAGVNARRGLGTSSNGVGRAFLGLGGVLGFVGGDGGDEVT
jgi:hypothetical protein